MKALSIRQPWAWLIVNGWKDIENRSWVPSFRGEFYVHAAGNLYGTIAERERIRAWVWKCFGVDVPDDFCLQRGGIVGVARVVDVVSRSRSPWFEGPHGLVLDRTRSMPFRQCKGRLGFFEVQS